MGELICDRTTDFPSLAVQACDIEILRETHLGSFGSILKVFSKLGHKVANCHKGVSSHLWHVNNQFMTS